MEKELESYDLYFRENDAKDRENIDFIIEDKYDNVAFVWGDTPDDVEVECNHPGQCVSYSDDEPTGYCELCGATCDCHYEADAGNVEDFYWSGRRLVPTEWTMPKQPGGVIGKYLKELKEKM